MKIKSATRYPKMVIGAMGVAFFIAVTYIIPTFAKIFKGAKITLPLPTRILIGFNDFVHEYWYLALGGVFLTYLIFRAYIKSEGGRAVWDGLKLRFPIVGQLYTKNLLSRFARILGVLDRSGIPILANLEVVAKVLNNVIVSRAVLNVRRNIEQGRSFAEPLRNSPIFPPMVVHMIAVGEESGTLDDMLFKVSDYYDAEVDNAIKNLSSLIEPLLIFFIGGLVLLLGLGIFMPMWEMATVVGK